jgi:hypothetical protein
MTLNVTDEDEARLRAARQKFVADMKRLTPKQQMARAAVIANGIRQSDPYQRALAQQMIDVAKGNERIEAAKAEIADIEAQVNRGGYRPKDPDWRGRLLTRREDLETEIQTNMMRQMTIAEDDLASAKRKAIREFRQRATREDRQQRIAEAVERKTAEAEQAAIEARADEIVKGRP